MAVQTSYPGVYVQEIPSGVRTITGVSTSITVFIGQASWGPVNVPTLCTSYSDFDRIFTSSNEMGDLARYVRLFFLNGGSTCYIMRLAMGTDAAAANNFAPATITLLDGAGVPAPSLIITARNPGELGNSIRANITGSTATTFNLRLYRSIVDVNNVELRQADVETFTGLSMDPVHPRFAPRYVNYKWVVLSETAGNVNSPANTVAGPPAVPAVLAGGQNGIAITTLEYDAAYPIIERELNIFNLMVLPPNVGGPAQNSLWGAASVFCQIKRAFLLMDSEAAWTTAQLASTGVIALRQASGVVSDYSAVFYPNLTVREPQGEVHVGASGAIAGLMARIDGTRGVWKAPAGTEASIRGINGVEYRFSDRENGVMNPRAVNTIRVFPDGIVNWGARTMAGDDDMASEYKYIPVRRTALFIEESLFRGLKWVVFEPNDEPLWAQIRLNVGAFMHNLFRQGAFQGTTKQEAYFVKCDKETTTQNDINLGVVNILVGFAPLKPAEFVVLTLQQMTGQIQV